MTAPPRPAADAEPTELSRRAFVATGVAAALAPATSACDAVAKAVPKHLRELTRDELRTLLQGLEADLSARYGKDVEVHATPAAEGVEFGYALDLSRCVGCRRCVQACVEENNQSRPSPEGKHNNPIQWIRVLEMDKERGVDLMHSDAYYNPQEVPREGHFYMPVQCQQCRNPPCVKVCPVEATWVDRDGVVVIDYDWCIGCRYCMVACPYGARHFNWCDPELPADEVNPAMHLQGNRPRSKGVVEKCTFCLQRTRAGRYPACVEICPVGARKFGNVLDPASEIRYILEHKRVFVLKEELNTQPRFFYFYGA